MLRKTKKVLLVDDDEDIRMLCQRELSGEGYTTYSVSSGLDALRFMDRNPGVDLIVLDIKMSPLDGIQILRELRAKTVDTPVILFSDYSIYKADFVTWLAQAYIVKSSDLTELKSKVKELLTS
jgi:DNA-binding response OmpR family regulator